ncbi:F-box-like domain-containing protein [Cephalotus follicularis]|uniref:F-box-like domain-containing protein n=1 Tax=Cephalotus follicularis TaxID=3775 RepID=A0A1Q3C5E7_CEPFO|nr:F-box-like domain-containing protein [Cephalotus follicularis]
MEPTAEVGVSGSSSSAKKRSRRGPATMQWVEHDILCVIFSFLGLFDLVRCSLVCKSWNAVINKSKLLQVLYCKLQGDSLGFSNTSSSQKSFNLLLEEIAMKHHRLSLQTGRLSIHQWKGHSVGVDQCRMKMGLILTGVGDKVIRLWSLDGYKCIEEYSIPDKAPLVDFDFDESKIVGLAGTRICIWRRNGNRSIFPSREGTFTRGLCMRYFDPEAVVGCDDGTARVFDMYSKKCSQIIRTRSGPITCLSLSDDQLILCGNSLGSITISGLLSDQRVGTLRSIDSTGIKTLCFNPSSHLVIAGTTAGYTSCWDLRTMRSLWEKRVSPNVIYSLQHLRNDKSTVVVGGIDGLLRILDQNTGEVVSSCVMEENIPSNSSQNTQGLIETKRGIRVPEDTIIDRIPRNARPPITCLAVGMKKVVTTHNGKYIRMWKFNK